MRFFPSFDPRLFAALAAACVLAWFSTAAAQNALSGNYEVAGKKATLTQLAAVRGKPESGKPITVLVFSAKDQTKAADPATSALFGELGDAIVVKLLDDGKVYSADLVHAAFDLPNNSVTIFGGATVKDFKKAGGQISGELVSTGDARGQKWTIDLTFSAKAP
jgi:hypothetical protein